jgi:hypothetical protein
MVAVLGTFGSVVLLTTEAHQSVSVVILAVVLALSLSRLPKPAGHRLLPLLDLVVVPMVALGASSLSRLLFTNPDCGAVVFTIALSGTMWLRQFGPTAARVAQLLPLPLIAVLIVPGIGSQGPGDRPWWQCIAAVTALAWVVAVRVLVGPRAPTAVRTSISSARTRTRTRTRTFSPHARMAIQLAFALAVAFVVGRTAFPTHWNWTVLTAFIVCSSGPARGEVALKGAARLCGAGLGTLLATLVAADLPGHGDGTVGLIFALLFVGCWWRDRHYAVWAACVTCVMALLSEYFGQPSGPLLGTRLLAILAGATCSIAICWCIFPTSTTTAVKRRHALAARTLRDVTNGQAPAHQLEARVRDLQRAVRPLALQQRWASRVRPPDHALLDSVGAVVAEAGMVLAGRREVD